MKNRLTQGMAVLTKPKRGNDVPLDVPKHTHSQTHRGGDKKKKV